MSDTTKESDDFLAGLLHVVQDGMGRAIEEIAALREERRHLRAEIASVPADFWWMAERIEMLEHQLRGN